MRDYIVMWERHRLKVTRADSASRHQRGNVCDKFSLKKIFSNDYGWHRTLSRTEMCGAKFCDCEKFLRKW